MSRSHLIRAIEVAVVLAFAGAAAPSSAAYSYASRSSSAPAPRAQHHRVEIRDLTFQPRDLEVAPGDTISWVNHDIVPHTVTAGDERWDSGEVPSGGTFTAVLDGTGALLAAGTGTAPAAGAGARVAATTDAVRPAGAETMRYLCRYHPTMIGSLRVAR